MRIPARAIAMRSRFVRSERSPIERIRLADVGRRQEEDGEKRRSEQEEALRAPDGHVEQKRREDPDVGPAGEREENRGQRHDAREPGQAKAPPSLERQAEEQPGGHGGQAREGHVVGERRADPIAEVVAAVEKLPDAQKRERRAGGREGQHQGPRLRKIRRRGPSRSAEAGGARDRRGAAC